MFNWIRSTGVRESRRHEIRLWRWTQAKYWLLTDTLAIVTKLSWWSMIIFPLSQWWSKNSDGLFRLSWRLLITPGLIAWTHLCPNMQIYPRFKINTNTRMQDLKERNICSQSKDGKIFDWHKEVQTFGIIESMLAQRSGLKSEARL